MPTSAPTSPHLAMRTTARPIPLPAEWATLLALEAIPAGAERARTRVDAPEHRTDPTPYRDDQRWAGNARAGEYLVDATLGSGDTNYFLTVCVWPNAATAADRAADPDVFVCEDPLLEVIAHELPNAPLALTLPDGTPLRVTFRVTGRPRHERVKVFVAGDLARQYVCRCGGEAFHPEVDGHNLAYVCNDCGRRVLGVQPPAHLRPEAWPVVEDPREGAPAA